MLFSGDLARPASWCSDADALLRVRELLLLGIAIWYSDADTLLRGREPWLLGVATRHADADALLGLGELLMLGVALLKGEVLGGGPGSESDDIVDVRIFAGRAPFDLARPTANDCALDD